MLPVSDLHVDTVLEVQGGADLGAGNPDGHVDIPRLRAGGASLMAFACFVPSILPAGRAFREATDLLDTIDGVCARFPGDLQKVETAADAEAARTSGRIAVLPAVENGHAIESDLGKLEQLRRRGARYLTLTHSRHLEWAASSGEEGAGPGGLTALGREVVREMERLGIIVDVSHVHESTFWDVVRVARKPFIASHSCAAALCPVARNLTDDQVKAVAGSGGLVGVNFFPGFLDPAYFDAQDATLRRLFAEMEVIEREYADDPARKIAESHRSARAAREARGPARADAGTAAAHVLHMVELVGADHVGIGSDFDGLPDLPRDLQDCAAYPRLLDRLAAAGLDAAALAKIAGGSFLRVLAACDR